MLYYFYSLNIRLYNLSIRLLCTTDYTHSNRICFQGTYLIFFSLSIITKRARKERHVFVLTEVEDEIVLALSYLINVLAPVKLLNVNPSHTAITYARPASTQTASCSSAFEKKCREGNKFRFLAYFLFTRTSSSSRFWQG